MDLLEKPTKWILVTFNSLSYLLLLTALAAGIAWIYYVAKAVEDESIGGENGGGDLLGPLSSGPAVSTEVMAQGAIVSILFYLVFRHHFSRSHY